LELVTHRLAGVSGPAEGRRWPCVSRLAMAWDCWLGLACIRRSGPPPVLPEERAAYRPAL